MAMTAIPVARLQSPSRSRVTTRLPDFLALMKPRVMSLAVFTALVGLMIAPGHLDPLLGSIAVLAIAAGAGAAGVLNMWYDADIDAVMARTAMRPIPRGTVSRLSACIRTCPCRQRSRRSWHRSQRQGRSTARLHDLLLRLCVHGLAEAACATKHRHRRRRRCASSGDRLGRRHRRHRAGAAHSLPDHLLLDATPFLGAFAQSYRRICPRRRPHAAGCCRKGRNNAADPHLQCSLGTDLDAAVGTRVCRHDLCVVALVCGAIFVVLALQLRRSTEGDRQAAHRLFVFSISYLFLLFAALLASTRRSMVVHV